MATATKEQPKDSKESSPVVDTVRQSVEQIGSLKHEAKEVISARLNDLHAEEKSLQEMLDQIEPQPVEAPAPAPQDGASAPRRRSRRKGGTRADQAVKLIEESPGLSAAEIAKELGINPNYMYRVLGELAKENRVKKDGSTYQPV